MKIELFFSILSLRKRQNQVFRQSYYIQSIESTMFRRAFTLLLLVIFVCNSNAKYKNYAHILESPEYKETLSLITPEKLLKSYNNTLTVYAGDKDWLNSSCHRELIILNEAIARREVWALTSKLVINIMFVIILS